MKQGFVKVAATAPNLRVADVAHNQKEICRLIDEAYENKAKVLVFPELSLTGYTCGDLFAQDALLQAARCALHTVIAHTKGKKILVFVGVPLEVQQKLYNVLAAVSNGELLGLTTKTFLPNHRELSEFRMFQPGPKQAVSISWDGWQVPFGPNILYTCKEMVRCTVSAEIGEDGVVLIPPSTEAVLAGATIIVNGSASHELVGKTEARKQWISGLSAREIAGYVCANAGEGESTTDLVFGGHHMIAENGTILKESKAFCHEIIYADIDVDKLAGERRRHTTFVGMDERKPFLTVPFSLDVEKTELSNRVHPFPFVPVETELRNARWEEILMIQAMGLKKRLAHTNCKQAVVGISGGLDSTLALLVTAKAFDLLGMDRKCIEAITMPCFGTTDRTYQNACLLTKKLGATLREVPIKEAVRVHFRDIGQSEECHDVTYENAQARERTQVLMDIANQTGGMVIGTGDLSELALGWATYNGDHMSMYAVNADVPKTLVRYLVQYCADTAKDSELKAVLLDILDTPVSPELLPPKEGEIAQKTEDLVGPYELHDFYLYYMLRYGFAPSKIYRLAKEAFVDMYDEVTIMKWLKKFYWRFFSQQFKRSCLPDGPKVGKVGVSPRGDLKMPSDACAALWLEELENL